MATFETLIFIPEGSLLNEKLAEKTALRQTLKHYGLDWGPAERLRYTSLEKEFKNLSSDDQIDLALSTFLKVQYKFLCKQKLDNKKRRVVPYNVNNDKNMGSPSYYELYRTVSYYSRCYA